MLTIVKAKPVDMAILYLEAYIRKLEQLSKSKKEPAEELSDAEQKELINATIVYGVRYISARIPKGRENLSDNDLLSLIGFINTIRECLGGLTPTELVNLFPVNKDFDGCKNEAVDYFSTMESIRSLDQDKPIGEKTDNLLMEYHNDLIRMFMVEMLCATSDMMRRKGYSGIMEQWAEKEGIPIYYKHTDPVTGKEFMINDETHRSVPISKIRSSYLKVVQ